MRIFIIFICIFLNSGNFYCQLIRPNVIYQNVIKEVYDYYNNMCIILLHVTEDPIENQGIRESENLLNLQGFFSRAYIHTAIMSISTFVEQIGESYYHIKRPLLVLLNDDDDVRQQFALKMAPWIDMAHPTWLIFFREETSIEKFFEDIYVQFDCAMMVTQPDGNISSPGEIITEVYQIDRGDQLRSSLLGTWNQEMGITLSQLSLYQRRNDFQGHTLRVMSIEDAPQSTIIRDHNGAITGFGGFFGGLLDLLQERMNCSILYQEINEWGVLSDNGSWTGAVGELVANRSDIFAAELIVTREKEEAISSSTTVFLTNHRTFIKRPATSALKWDAYFVPFEPRVWITIVVMIAITTITMSLVNSAISMFASYWKDNKDPTRRTNILTSIPDIFFAVFGVFCNQGMAASILDPIRITHFVIHLTGVIILAAYSAALISALAVKTFVLPFTTIEGLLHDGTYRFGVVGDSSEYTFFQNSSDEMFKAIFNKLLIKEKNLPNNYIDGLDLVCNEDKYAFMTLDIIVSELQSELGCTLVPLDQLGQTTMAFALRPRSPYRGIVNSHLLRMRDSGVMQRLLNPDWVMTRDNVDGGFVSVEIKNILPLLVLLLSGVFMSLIILSMEMLLKRNRKIIKKEKKIAKKILKNVKLSSTQINHLQPFYN